MNTNLSTVFRTLLIQYQIVANILKFPLITFLTARLFTRKDEPLKYSQLYFPNTEIILYGKGDLDNINNTSVLDAIINYLIETKRFDAQFFFLLFGCHGFNIDIAFKIHIFVLFTVFLVSIIFIFLLFLGYFFNLVCTFVPRYITIFICIPDDYKFWWF